MTRMVVTAEARSLRERLRSATSTAHSRVDELFGSCDLCTQPGFVRFLRAQAAAWEALRPVLEQGSLARADALRADLDRLGIALPAAVEAPALPDANSLGLRYVLEGSRLGSTVLLRELAAKAPQLAENAAYFRESSDIEPWKRLSTLLQTDRDGPDNDRLAIEDALFVFGLFERAWWATDSAQTETESL